MSLEIWSFVVDVLSLIATVVLTVAIYWLQRSHEKEREQMEVEAQKKAIALNLPPTGPMRITVC